MTAIYCRFFARILNRQALGERSGLKFTVNTTSKKICAFSENESTLVVVTKDGRYFQRKIGSDGIDGPEQGELLLQSP